MNIVTLFGLHLRIFKEKNRETYIDKDIYHNYNIIMISFEWDNNKNQQNIRKHSIDFKEAKTVFLDNSALIISDPDHSDFEERFIILGMSAALRILVVCHCSKSMDESIRIISARKATKKEVDEYEKRI